MNAGRKGVAYDWQSLLATAEAATLDLELADVDPAVRRMTCAPSRVLVLGCGSVAQCTVPLLVRDLGDRSVSASRSSTSLDNRARIADVDRPGRDLRASTVSRPTTSTRSCRRGVGDGDLLLDLAWNIDNPTILQWCRDHGVRYLNTSVEVWDPYVDLERRPIRSIARCTCATWTCAG